MILGMAGGLALGLLTIWTRLESAHLRALDEQLGEETKLRIKAERELRSHLEGSGGQPAPD